MPRPFETAILTDAGARLLTRSLAGEITVEFTKMAVGNGEYDAMEKSVAKLQKRTKLMSPKNIYLFSDISIYDEHSVKLTSLISNQDPATTEVLVDEGYYINEIGIFARESGNPDATEVLYSISITSGDRGDYMPAYNGHSPAQITQDFFVTVGNSGEVTIHSAGAVLLRDGDAKDVTVTFDEAEKRENISSGEKLSILLGKIKKFFLDLKPVAFSGSYKDLADKPTAEDIGAFSSTEGTELKKSVSDGKKAVAVAITGMGVTTAADASFDVIEGNIKQISADTTAVASEILKNKTAFSKGAKVTGTMANNGAVSKELSAGGSYTVPTGYHNGSGKVTAKSLAAQTGVDSGKTAAGAPQILTGYQAWVNGSKVTGTLFNAMAAPSILIGRGFNIDDIGFGRYPAVGIWYLDHVSYSQFGLHGAVPSSAPAPTASSGDSSQINITVNGNINVYRSSYSVDVTKYRYLKINLYGKSLSNSGSNYFRGYVGLTNPNISSSASNEGSNGMAVFAQYKFTNTSNNTWLNAILIDITNINGSMNFSISCVHGGFVDIQSIAFIPKEG